MTLPRAAVLMLMLGCCLASSDSRIPVTEECPAKCVCLVSSDDMMDVTCYSDEEFKALQGKPIPPVDNSDAVEVLYAVIHHQEDASVEQPSVKSKTVVPIVDGTLSAQTEDSKREVTEKLPNTETVKDEPAVDEEEEEEEEDEEEMMQGDEPAANEAEDETVVEKEEENEIQVDKSVDKTADESVDETADEPAEEEGEEEMQGDEPAADEAEDEKVEKDEENEIEVDKPGKTADRPVDEEDEEEEDEEEEMQAAEPADEEKDENKEVPEELIGDSDAQVVSKKGVKLVPTSVPEMQDDQPVEDAEPAEEPETVEEEEEEGEEEDEVEKAPETPGEKTHEEQRAEPEQEEADDNEEETGNEESDTAAVPSQDNDEKTPDEESEPAAAASQDDEEKETDNDESDTAAVPSQDNEEKTPDEESEPAAAPLPDEEEEETVDEEEDDNTGDEEIAAPAAAPSQDLNTAQEKANNDTAVPSQDEEINTGPAQNEKKASSEEEEEEEPLEEILKPDGQNSSEEQGTGLLSFLNGQSPSPMNETDNSDKTSTMASISSRIRLGDLDPVLLPDGEILVTDDQLDEAMSGKMVSDSEEPTNTDPQQSAASWIILGIILTTFVSVLGYAAIRGRMDKKTEEQNTLAKNITMNPIPPVFDPKSNRKPDFEGTEMKVLSHPLLKPHEDENVREYKDDELQQVVVAGGDTSSLPYIDAPNSVSKPPRKNAPPSPVDLSAPSDLSRNDPPSPLSPSPTTPTLVRTRMYDQSPQLPRIVRHVNGSITDEE